MTDRPENRRKFARVTLEAKIRIVLPGVDARRQLFIDNLSAGGLFICTEQPKAVGSKVRFEFLVRDGGPKIMGAGIVQWIETNPEKPPGMGIKFLEINDAGRKEITEILKEKNAK